MPPWWRSRKRVTVGDSEKTDILFVGKRRLHRHNSFELITKNNLNYRGSGGRSSRMWTHVKGKTSPWFWAAELCWSNQSRRQREGTSFKACFIESRKKPSGWIVPRGNQCEETDINLGPPLRVNKHASSVFLKTSFYNQMFLSFHVDERKLLTLFAFI